MYLTMNQNKSMKKFLKYALAASTFALIAACGGGGGGEKSDDNANVTYTEFAGYTWSSTTNELVINPSGLFVGLEKTASEYCSKQTCDIDQYGDAVNCRASNFNGQTGWSLPTEDQLQNFYRANPNPSGWIIGPIWSSTGGERLDFRTGTWSSSRSSTSVKAHVTCVKPIASSGGGSSNSVPILSTSSFNLLSAYISTIATPSTYNFTISGTVDSLAITGSGAEAIGSVSNGTFESRTALQRTTTITGSLQINGESYPLNSSEVSWTDLNYVPLGSVGEEYTVINGTASLPTAIRVGDTGSIYVANRYADSSKLTSLGTVTSTYVVEADTASTALVTLINTYKSNSNLTERISTSQFRINTQNSLTRVKTTGYDSSNGLRLVISY